MLRLVLLSLLVACDDEPTPEPDAGAHGLRAAALTSPAWLGVVAAGSGVWFVGGTLDPPAAAVGRFDGQLHAEAVPGAHLWWVFGFDSEHLWACGAGGRILRRQNGTWTEEPTGLPASAVLWGIWGSSPTDLWAVGGTDTSGGPRGVVLRSAGDGRWQRVLDPALPLEDPRDDFAGLNLYKVWGVSSTEVYLVGEGGLAMRWNGNDFKKLETDTSEILFTVHGQPDGLVIAVGGLSGGVVRRLDGDRFVAETIPQGPALNGIFVRPDGTALATGAQGLVLSRDTGGRWQRRRAPDTSIGTRTLHAVLVAGETTWAVGGDLTALRDGVVATDRATLPGGSL